MTAKIHNLATFCEASLSKMTSKRDVVRRNRETRGYWNKVDFILEIRDIIGKIALKAALEKVRFPSFEISFVDRASFNADVTFRSTELIKAEKNLYLNEICPSLVNMLSSLEYEEVKLFEKVEQKGIYVNAKFSTAFLFSQLRHIEAQGAHF